MRITVARRKEIERLADALAAIAPSTTPGAGFCVQKVAEQKGLKSCWKKQKNKKQDIAELLVKVIRQYPRKPKALVLAIVEGGAQWTANRGEAVTQDHLEAIIDPMEALGFKVRKEIEAIELPEPSKVATPSQDVVATLDRLDLHIALQDDCAEMFRNGHFNEAVRKALERFEKKIQDTINDHRSFGRTSWPKPSTKATR